ncbi:MAG: peptidoglycan DD-metalloendopeptidase family protein [Taibaiella sp.]|nr:peptidoglycan DD-metalloendopeptidase family protein [Taibaiella sp.]
MRQSFFIICFMVTLVSFGQEQQVKYNNNYVPPTKAELEVKRKQLQDAITETENQLAEIKKNKNATISQLKALQYKLSQRQTLIGNINQEISGIDNTIVSSSKEIVTLKQKLEMLKIRYAQSIRYAYQTRSSYDMVAFLFSSADFNDAVRRMKYLKKFRDFRKQQVDQIKETQGKIQNKIGDLNKEKEEKDQLLNSQKQQSVALLGDVKETNNVIQDLKGREAELVKQAEKNRKAAARVNKFIEDVIKREMEAAAKKAAAEAAAAAAKAAATAAANNATKPNNATTGPAKTEHTTAGNNPPPTPARTKPRVDGPPLMLTPTDVAVANSFEGNKGKLYWPVAQGTISDHFGQHQHPLAKYVIIDNPGIDIRTNANATARAVYEGNVSSVIGDEGSKIVIIQHGNYFTVYNNLETTSVSRGQHVNTLQSIGTVATNDEGEPTIKFQIWKSGAKGQTQKFNPELWIGRAH